MTNIFVPIYNRILLSIEILYGRITRKDTLWIHSCNRLGVESIEVVIAAVTQAVCYSPWKKRICHAWFSSFRVDIR